MAYYISPCNKQAMNTHLTNVRMCPCLLLQLYVICGSQFGQSETPEIMGIRTEVGGSHWLFHCYFEDYQRELNKNCSNYVFYINIRWLCIIIMIHNFEITTGNTTLNPSMVETASAIYTWSCNCANGAEMGSALPALLSAWSLDA